MPDLNPYEAPQTIDNDNADLTTPATKEVYEFRRWMLFLSFMQTGLIQLTFYSYETNNLIPAVSFGVMAMLLTVISIFVSIARNSWSWLILQAIMLLALRYVNSSSVGLVGLAGG